MTIELTPHKGYVTLKGHLVGTLNEKAFTEGVGKNGKPWQKANIGVKTSDKNIIYVEVIGSVMDKVYAYNQNTKSTLAIDWDRRHEPLPSGYKFFNPSPYDVVTELKKMEEGTSVFVKAHLEFQEYNEKLQSKVVIDNVFKTTDPIDFTAEEFKETCTFVQDITINNVQYDKDLGKVFVNAYVFTKQGKDKPVKVDPAQFVLNPNKSEAIGKLAKKFMTFKFGDTLKVEGLVHNRAIVQEAKVEDDWGGERQTYVKSTQRELEITFAHSDSYEKGKYKEKDVMAIIAKQNEEKEMAKVFSGEQKTDDLPWGDKPSTGESSGESSDDEGLPDWLKGE